jgi:hypothetical protein
MQHQAARPRGRLISGILRPGQACAWAGLPKAEPGRWRRASGAVRRRLDLGMAQFGSGATVSTANGDNGCPPLADVRQSSAN